MIQLTAVKIEAELAGGDIFPRCLSDQPLLERAVRGGYLISDKPCMVDEQ